MGSCPSRALFEADYAVSPGQGLGTVTFDFASSDFYRVGLNIQNTRFASLPPCTVLVWQNGVSANGIWRNDGQQRDDDGNRVLTPTVPGLPNLTTEMIAATSCNDSVLVYVRVLNPQSPDLTWFRCFQDRAPGNNGEWGLRIAPSGPPPPETLATLPVYRRGACTSCDAPSLPTRATLVAGHEAQAVSPLSSSSSAPGPQGPMTMASSPQFIYESLDSLLNDYLQLSVRVQCMNEACKSTCGKMRLRKFMRKFRKNQFQCCRTHHAVPVKPSLHNERENGCQCKEKRDYCCHHAQH